MTSKAKTSSRDLGHGGVFIDHADLTKDDLDWLGDVERLVLWDVTVPADFLFNLERLWWVDWRGGSARQGVDQVRACRNLRYLSLNQIRGLTDSGFLEDLQSLELLNLYGLAKISSLPTMLSSTNLRRAQIGQMKSLTSIGPLLDAPNLQEIQLHNWIGVSEDDVRRLQTHPSLAAFEWFGENIPGKMWVPVCDAVGLPKTRAMHPEEWFGLSS